MDNEKWILDKRQWHEYPIGTKAKATMGGHWIKTEHGWHWPGGSTFSAPGGDATGEVCLPFSDVYNQLSTTMSQSIKELNKEDILKTKWDSRFAIPMPFGYEGIYEAMQEYADLTAQEYATKAQKLVEALKMAKREIVALYKQKGYSESFVTRTIDETLSSWNEGKEGKQQDPRDNPLIGEDDSWIHDTEMGDR